jgi:hypothetical protein
MAYSKDCISASEQTPQSRDSRQQYSQENNDQGDLQPDKAADFPEDKLDARAPWRRNGIANDLHAALDGALQSGQQFRLLVKCSADA